jgi:hypothetical protein
MTRTSAPPGTTGRRVSKATAVFFNVPPVSSRSKEETRSRFRQLSQHQYCRLNSPLPSARRNENDGRQIVEAAVWRRALSARSCAGPTHVGAASPHRPISNTTIRRAEAFPILQSVKEKARETVLFPGGPQPRGSYCAPRGRDPLRARARRSEIEEDRVRRGLPRELEALAYL